MLKKKIPPKWHGSFLENRAYKSWNSYINQDHISGGGTPVVGINLLFKASPELFNGSDLGAGWWIDLLEDKEQSFVSHEPLNFSFCKLHFRKMTHVILVEFFLTFLKIKNSCFMRFLRNRWTNFKKLGHFWKFQTLSFPMS